MAWKPYLLSIASCCNGCVNLLFCNDPSCQVTVSRGSQLCGHKTRWIFVHRKSHSTLWEYLGTQRYTIWFVGGWWGLIQILPIKREMHKNQSTLEDVPHIPSHILHGFWTNAAGSCPGYIPTHINKCKNCRRRWYPEAYPR